MILVQVERKRDLSITTINMFDSVERGIRTGEHPHANFQVAHDKRCDGQIQKEERGLIELCCEPLRSAIPQSVDHPPDYEGEDWHCGACNAMIQ